MRRILAKGGNAPSLLRNLDAGASESDNHNMCHLSPERAIKFALVACFLVLYLSPAFAQVAVSPAKVTMLVGDSQRFRVVDSRGRMLTSVHWTISRKELADVAQGADISVVAKQPGRFTLTAHASEGYAEAQVEVLQGTTMPVGTIRWSGVNWPGCKTSEIIPAVPSATGVADVFENAMCADGQYVAAYTAQGIMAWRRKLTGKNGGQLSAEEVATAAAQLNTHRPSICDSISISMKKDDAHALLAARQLTANSESETVWVIEEDGTECRLWFNAQSQITKKRKTLVSE